MLLYRNVSHPSIRDFPDDHSRNASGPEVALKFCQPAAMLSTGGPGGLGVGVWSVLTMRISPFFAVGAKWPPAYASVLLLHPACASVANHVGSQRARFPEKPQGNLFLILERFPQNRLRHGLWTENGAGGCRQRRWPRFLVGGPRAKSDFGHQLDAIVTSLENCQDIHRHTILGVDWQGRGKRLQTTFPSICRNTSCELQMTELLLEGNLCVIFCGSAGQRAREFVDEFLGCDGNQAGSVR